MHFFPDCNIRWNDTPCKSYIYLLLLLLLLIWLHLRKNLIFDFYKNKIYKSLHSVHKTRHFVEIGK